MPGVRCEELDTGGHRGELVRPRTRDGGAASRGTRAPGPGWQRVIPQPVIGLGGTDARFWRVRGVPAFVHGCSPAGMGAADESISIEEFRRVLRTHALAAFDYLQG